MRCRRARDELRVGSRARAVTTPPICYAENGDVHIAYQVVGDGPLDLVCVMGTITNLHVLWDDPEYRRFCERLTSFSRLILFDKRGLGLSDRVRAGTLEDRMDDVRAILDDLGSESAAPSSAGARASESTTSRRAVPATSASAGSPAASRSNQRARTMPLRSCGWPSRFSRSGGFRVNGVSTP